mmetsp:Transcript_23413/g.35032  ORF Transcript_23413/g.35032 Transcript_23413/m.35032 type:complete len:169 (-) Transcript_23413:433-939(-)
MLLSQHRVYVFLLQTLLSWFVKGSNIINDTHIEVVKIINNDLINDLKVEPATADVTNLTSLPSSPPTLVPTPSPSSSKPTPKKKNNVAGEVFLYLFISIASGIIIGLCWVKRKEMCLSMKNTWTTFRRYGCRGCFHLLFRKRVRPSTSVHEALNQIILDPEDDYNNLT